MISLGGSSYMPKYYDQYRKKASIKYMKNNTLSIAFRLNRNTEQDLIEIYQSIPNKKDFLRDALLNYASSTKKNQ